MLRARIVGTATATVSHPGIKGCRHLLCEVLDHEGGPTGRIVVAVDRLGAGAGSEVLVTADGEAACRGLAAGRAPLRNAVFGIIDSTGGGAS